MLDQVAQDTFHVRGVLLIETAEPPYREELTPVHRVGVRQPAPLPQLPRLPGQVTGVGEPAAQRGQRRAAGQREVQHRGPAQVGGEPLQLDEHGAGLVGIAAFQCEHQAPHLAVERQCGIARGPAQLADPSRDGQRPVWVMLAPSDV